MAVWVRFGVQLGLRQTQAQIIIYTLVINTCVCQRPNLFFYWTELNTKLTQTATKWWPFGFVFSVQLDLRQTQALLVLLITSPSSSCWMMVWLLLLISACIFRRPSWTPKIQPNDSSAVVWLSFWCSIRFTRKKCLSQHGETYILHSYIFYYGAIHILRNTLHGLTF